MADDWDAEDFEPPPPVVAKEASKTQWDDEDKEEEKDKAVKESWEEEAAPPAPAAPAAKKEAKPKASKKKKEEATAKEELADPEVLADPVAEKLRQQRLVEESDLKATRELFGERKKEGEKSLDDFIPKTEAEFKEYAELVAAKVTPLSKSFHYVPLLAEFLRRATLSLGSKETKELSTTLSALANEKLKKEKEATAGKKKAGTKKQQLKVDNPEDDDFRGGGGFTKGVDDEYDFM